MLEGRMGKILTDARVMARRRFFYLGLEKNYWSFERAHSTHDRQHDIKQRCLVKILYQITVANTFTKKYMGTCLTAPGRFISAKCQLWKNMLAKCFINMSRKTLRQILAHISLTASANDSICK
jgi:hypothetical protein